MHISRIFILVALLSVLIGCGRAETSAEQPTSSDIVNLLQTPIAPGESVEVVAYSTRIGRIAPSQVGQCPTWIQTLTDQPFAGTLQILDGQGSNYPPEDLPQLIIPDSETLPYHARLRGHRGDPRYADCARAERIFVVDEIEQVYEQEPPAHLTIQPEIDASSWQRYTNTAFGYSFLYPPDRLIEETHEPDTVASLLVWDAQKSGPPIHVRVYKGETFIDPFDPALAHERVRGGRSFIQNQIFSVKTVESQEMLGYQIVNVEDNPQTIRVVFNGQGYSYEISLQFSYTISQSVLDTLSVMVASFHLDAGPSPTPLPIMKTAISADAALSQAEIVEHARAYLKTDVALLEARLAGLTEVQQQVWDCRTYQGNPTGVWLLTMRASVEGLMRTLQIAFDATTGEALCGGEIRPDQPTGATPDPNHTSTPVPTVPTPEPPTSALPAITSLVISPEVIATPLFPTVTVPTASAP